MVYRSSKPSTLRMSHGFTLTEIMVVVGILVLIMMTVLVSMRKQRSKAEDARVKTDLELLKIAFENYYTDNNCYPPQTWFDAPNDCGSTNLQPYLSSIPCDKKTNRPYILEYAPTQCSGFRLYATLQNSDDPAVQRLIDPAGSTSGNYGVSSANTTVKVLLPTDTSHNYTWCSAIGNCTSFDPTSFSCNPFYVDDANCGGGCTSVGSCVAN